MKPEVISRVFTHQDTDIQIMFLEILLGRMYFGSIQFSLLQHLHFSVFTLAIYPLKHHCKPPTVSFPSGLVLLAQRGTALSDITDVVGKYRFADAELM